MNVQDIKVLLLEDDVFKAQEVKRALDYCGIRKDQIIQAENQKAGLEILVRCREEGSPAGLIVTDMSYPLEAGLPEDENAGEKLIERLKEEQTEIPVILCSSIRYRIPEIAGCVWYNKLRDINQDFKKIIDGIA